MRSLRAAGAILIAGSDAPVDTRDLRPFVNLKMAVTRSPPVRPPLNPSERIPICDVIDAYTSNGAKYLNRDQEAGSIETRKWADFIVVDHAILALAGGGHAKDIDKTKIVATDFRGIEVYRRPPP